MFTSGDFDDFEGNGAAASFYVKAETSKTTTTTTKRTTTKTTTKSTTRKATTSKSTTKKTTTTTKNNKTTTTKGNGNGGTTPTTSRNTAGPITNPTTGTPNTAAPITNPQGEIITTNPNQTHPTTTMTDAQGNPITIPTTLSPGSEGNITYPTSIRYVTNEAGEVIWSEIINRTDAFYTEKRDRPTRTYEKQFPGLELVRVDNYQVVYKDGKYYATTDPLDDEVIISAIPSGDTIVLGMGTRGIAVGKNVVELVLKDGDDTTSVQVIITRPDGIDVRDTSLTALKVVDYEFEFDPSITEYSISVPYTTKELYVLAKAFSEDATIGGDGLVTIIDNENNDIYVQVSYGSMAPTEYVIHVKKNYTMLILWIVIGLLSLGLIGMVIYAYANKKEAVSKVTAEKDKVIAEGNRTATSEIAKDAVIGGESLSGLTRRTVKPIPVNDPLMPERPGEIKLVQEQQTPNTQEVRKEPVELAGSAPQPQVRVIRRTSEPQIKTSAASGIQYQEDNIVIKEL